MYWPDTNTGVDIEPARKPVASAVRKFFTEGGAGQSPTVPGGDWFNQITNELLNVLAAAGIDPSKTDDDQLLQAINGISKALSAREALRRTYAEAGYTLVPGSFELGGTVTTETDVLLYEADGKAYSFSGTLPHTVDGDSAPSDELGMWVDRSTALLSNGMEKPVTHPSFAGGADPTGSLSSVAAFSAGKAQGSTTYVPKGVYLIDSSVDLSNSEWDFARGAVLNITGTAVVTIGNVKAGLYNIFSGSGGVVFTTENDVVYPEWFLASAGDAAQPALTKCAAACATNKVRMHISNNLKLASAWIINSRFPITCNPRASFDAISGATGGVEIREGAVNWNCKIELPNIAGFSGFGVKLRGCSLINLHVGAIANCGDGMVFECLSGAAPNVLDNNVRVQSVSGCTTAFVTTGDNSANIFQGNEVYCNFVVGCNAAVEYRGSVQLTNFDSNTWEFSAIDGAIDGSVGLKNSTAFAVSKVNFFVKNWAGGFGGSGKLADGKFNGSIIRVRINAEPPYSAMNVTGAGNILSYERIGNSNTTPYACVFNAVTALADFNSGNPVNNNQIPLRLTTQSPIPPGSSVVAYACTPLDDGFTLAYSVSPTNTNGLVMNYVRRESKNVVRIGWFNHTATTLAAGTIVDFTLDIIR